MVKTPHIVKRVSYGMLATALVLGLSPTTFALAEQASLASNSLVAQATVASNGTFTFADSGIQASSADSSSYTVSTDSKTGAQVLTIKSAGTYEITGSCSNGYIEVKKGLDGVVLVLDGLTLSTDGEKVIKFKAGCTNSQIVLKGTNTLSSDNDKAIIKAKAVEDTDSDGNDYTVLDDNGYATGGDLTISGDGTLNLSSSYTATVDGETEDCDAINCEGNLTVLSGTFNIDVTDDAMHSDYVLQIGQDGTAGPTINVAGATEGLEGATVNLLSGTGDITTTDDGINAANSDLTSYGYEYAINISGGTWNVVAAGDGIDSNGNLTISGGTTNVYCTGNGNGALDIGEGSEGEIQGTFTYTGGEVFAVGSDMLVTPSQGTYVLFGGAGGMGAGGMGPGFGAGPGGNAQSGTSVVEKDHEVTISDGSSTLFQTTAKASGSYVLYMSDSLKEGGSYTLTSGSNAAQATAASGQYAGGAFGQNGPGGQNGQGGFGQGGPGGQGNFGQGGPGNQQGHFGPGQPGQRGQQESEPSTSNGTAESDTGNGNAAADTGPQENSSTESVGSTSSTDASAESATQSTQEQTADASQGSAASKASTSSSVKKGDTVTAGSGASKASYKVTKVAKGKNAGTVTYTKSKVSSKIKKATVPATVKINGKTYKVTAVGTKAFKKTKVTQVTIGKNVKKLAKNSFKSSKVTKLVVKTKKLTKKSTANSLKGSKVKTVKVKVGSAKQNKKYVTKYTKLFGAKKIGKKNVKVK